MASNTLLLVTSQQAIKGELSMFTMCDSEIMNEIYATHVHDDDTFDADSLFIVAESILRRATHIADNFVLGAQSHQEISLEEKVPKASFSPPLCILKQLFAEMACQTPGEGIAHKTTMSVLEKLSSYSWDAKVVLTLAAFSFEYGDFWLLAQLPSSDELAKSVGILKRVPDISKLLVFQKYGKAILELNNLIKATLEVIKSIFELKKLYIYDTKDVPALSSAMDRIPVDVYWAIITIVACTTQMCYLTSDEDKTQELSPFAQKIKITLHFLKRQIKLCYQQIEETKAYRKLKKIIRTHDEIVEVFRVLIFADDNVHQLIDGSTGKLVTINVLRKKNVLLLFSGLDISIDEISTLKLIDDGIRKEDQYKIVWIPIVEEWTNDVQRKFQLLQSKMSWYIVQYFAPVVGIRFIKEEWKFENKSMIVVMNPQGKVEHLNALHMIRVWGMKAFPFTKEVEVRLVKETNWIGDILVGIHPNLQHWIKEEKYIFFYGGKDREWIQQFGKKAIALANHPIIKETRISIELFCLGKGSNGDDDLEIQGRFWNKVESLFFSAKTDKETEQDTVMQQIQRLLSFKNESGWAILSKGSRVVVSDGTIILKVLDEFEKWKCYVHANRFETCFIEYHKLIEGDRSCCSVDIPFAAERIPKHMKCPYCTRLMETYVSFKCRHIDGAMNALH